MSKQKKRPSMQDVANLAGVSRTTVSFVLNQVPDANIPLGTQDRIWAAVEELGYRPNAIARGLRAQQTHTLGFISDHISTTPYAVQIFQGAQDLAWQHKYLLLAVNTGGDQGIKEAGVNMLLDRQVDGIIYATMYHREVDPPEAIREVPTVLLDCFVANRSLPSVVPDELLGGFKATRYLLQKGHRHVAFLCEETAIPAAVGRLAGYKKALAEFGLPHNDTLVKFGTALPKEAYAMTLELFQSDTKPTAIFCFNDRMAMGVYDALRQLGLAIPDDVAVVGFDNQQLIAADIYPGLTTMELPHYEMGQWAVNHLLALINEKEQAKRNSPVQRMIQCPLIERSSA